MNRTSIFKGFLAAALAVAALFAAIPRTDIVPTAQAATTNVSIANPGVMLIPLHISGQYTTTTASVAKFNMPMPCDMLGVGASARAVGTTATYVDVKSGGTTILSSAITMSTSYTEGTISTAAVPDENAITVDINMPAGASTINDTTVLLTCVRK